jgi:hypothetical protein
MTATWVHGNAFVPRLYGPDNLANVMGIGWTDQQGLRDGHQARFSMLDERTNWFHAIIPVTDVQQLNEVRVEYSTSWPLLTSAWVQEGSFGSSRMAVNTNSPVFNAVGSDYTFIFANINRQVDRGLCISLAFTTVGAGLGAGDITFYAAGAIFA